MVEKKKKKAKSNQLNRKRNEEALPEGTPAHVDKAGMETEEYPDWKLGKRNEIALRWKHLLSRERSEILGHITEVKEVEARPGLRRSTSYTEEKAHEPSKRAKLESDASNSPEKEDR